MAKKFLILKFKWKRFIWTDLERPTRLYNSKTLDLRQPNLLLYEKPCMAIMRPNLGFLGIIDWELCLLEVVQFCGPLLAILTPVQWCQVTHRNKIYTHHILPHIGHWWSFGNNLWSTISSPSFRSFLGVDLTHLIKPSVPWSAKSPWETSAESPWTRGNGLRSS